jgi:hypothetical protein
MANAQSNLRRRRLVNLAVSVDDGRDCREPTENYAANNTIVWSLFSGYFVVIQVMY